MKGDRKMRLVTEYLDASAERFPNKTAFADEKQNITFAQLQKNSYKIATSLIGKNIAKKPVVILLDKSVECIACFMGVAYSGNFYTPIDTKMPISRMKKILEILQPEVMITDHEHEQMTKELEFNGEILKYEDLMLENEDVLKIKQRVKCLIDTDILYVLFTSGSTGTPKGVIISHRSVIDYTEWVTETFEIDSNSIFGNQAPFYFDNSILDMYQTIKNAAMMYIIPERLFAFPVNLLQYLEEKKINVIFWVPSALCIVANLKALGKFKLSNLQKILFCGEVMPNKQLNAWRRSLPQALFANLYGPTEITDVCAYYIVDREFNDDESLPIGIPCKNTDILVLNEENKVGAKDEIGELCVRGTSLALGYYNNSQKTAETFVQNPLNENYPEIIYRTGDLVRYNEFGELLYVSRKDFQIKHMGHRIELGEIETAISAIRGIDSNCCIYDEKLRKIVLFYTGEVLEDTIVKQLKKSVPEYMIPNKKVHLEEMPFNLNGKIDRVELKKML
jgi:amino acid adenylation domain-containing protein